MLARGISLGQPLEFYSQTCARAARNARIDL